MQKSEKEAYAKMYRDLARQLIVGVLSVLILTLTAGILLHCMFDIEFVDASASLSLGVIGVVLAFIGNTMVMDAGKRLGTSSLPQWKWGNRIQALGFSLTIVALLIK